MIPMSSTKVKAPPILVVLLFSYTIHIWIVCVVCVLCVEREIFYIHHVYTYELGGNPS